MTAPVRMPQRAPSRRPDRRFKIALRVGDWPQEDRRRWAVAFDEGARLDERGGGVDLRPATRTKVEYAYGRWLAYLRDTAPELLDLPAASRLERARVEAFVEKLAETNEWNSIVSVLYSLRHALRLIEPGGDYPWLRRIENRMAREARPKSRMDRFVPADELHEFGLQLMDEAELEFDAAEADLAAGKLALPLRKNPRIKLLKAAVRYRDGLVIAVLTQASLRRRNISGVTLDGHLVRTGDAWSIVIPAEEAKGHAELDYPLTFSLSARIDRYVARFRPEFPGAKDSSALWLAAWGRELLPGDLYEAIYKRTQQGLGRPINLHFFRHIVATFIAVEAPEQAPMIRDYLAHVSGDTADGYYKKASGVAASRRAHEILASFGAADGIAEPRADANDLSDNHYRASGLAKRSTLSAAAGPM